MNKADLVEELHRKTGLPKVKAHEYVGHFLDSIQEALARGEKVTISDFGTFQVSSRKAFMGNNPVTKERIPVSERRIPVFRGGKGLKEALNTDS
jgi:DNA-binding protein HU-beta